MFVVCCYTIADRGDSHKRYVCLCVVLCCAGVCGVRLVVSLMIFAFFAMLL